jgi:hypothetical protein
VQTAFPFVVFGAVALSVVMSVGFLISRGSIYDEIGQGDFSRDGERGGARGAPATDTPAGRAEQELEIRQMLSARSERLVRAGQPALDIDAEVARLVGPSQPRAYEPGLSEEVRQLVVARNERRVRQGLQPLEVEAEVVRTLEELER